jgi:hypothetical protein
MRLLILGVVPCEVLPGVIIEALDVEGDWQVFEDILALTIVKGLHVVVESLLVPQELVAFEVVMDLSLS